MYWADSTGRCNTSRVRGCDGNEQASSGGARDARADAFAGSAVVGVLLSLGHALRDARREEQHHQRDAESDSRRTLRSGVRSFNAAIIEKTMNTSVPTVSMTMTAMPTAPMLMRLHAMVTRLPDPYPERPDLPTGSFRVMDALLGTGARCPAS